MDFDPRHILKEVESRYQAYLSTTFSFRDPALRASFQKALDGTGSLAVGPYIEGRPIFASGLTLEHLCKELLKAMPDEAFLHALDEHYGKRKLYSHQENAIRYLLQDRNVIVATGTGSGKTDAFLFPVLLDLYREFTEGRKPGASPGVRALILYPMNALANDQKRKLRGIARRLKDGGSAFSFTFGEYIGATPYDRKDQRATGDWLREVEKHLPLGEIAFRDDIREAPPDILLTNFSMLEYLLIRPDDSPLFDRGASRHWQTLVLDEAHQYMGIRGAEMGMLMRRLKQRLREGGRAGTFRCIATSATLTGSQEDHGEVAAFASQLFGEPFEPQQVITGDLVEIAAADGKESVARTELHHGDYLDLRKDLKGFSDGQPSPQERESLGEVLQSDSRSFKFSGAVVRA